MQLNKKPEKILATVKKLSRQQFIVFTILLLTAVGYGWVKMSQPSLQRFNGSIIELPNTQQLQQRIDNKLIEESILDQKINSSLDDIIDNQAMQAKLYGLTKNITLTREPTEQELDKFYRRHQQQYRELSYFRFTQYLFTHIQYGGQAKGAAKKMLKIPLSQRTHPAELISLNSIQANRRYGEGFSEKIIQIAKRHSHELPCWTQPITSKVGAHILCFEKLSIGAIPDLSDVKPLVTNHWRFETSKLTGN